MLNEGRKILSLPELKVTCTCVRVPVYRSHSISVTAQFENLWTWKLPAAPMKANPESP